MSKINSRQHIIIGLSGGVDSSVSAYLLKKAGHHVEGVFMKNWEADDNDEFCSAANDIKDAQAVCDLLNIQLQVVNFSNDYWQHVFTYFLEDYQRGRTPNPDILCNKEIKFKAFLNYAKQQGADAIATGHYVRKLITPEGVFLRKAADPHKDQSYFLAALAEDQIAQSIFPIGELTKSTVRAIAAEIGLKNHNKKDSTGICFIGERKFKTFLNEFVLAKPGAIKTLDGQVLGQHDGLMFHTIGQRQGLNIGGQKGSAGAFYVAQKNIAANELIVVQGANHPALFQAALTTTHIHWINPAQAKKTLPREVAAITRYRQADQACSIHPAENHYRVCFKEPQRAICPGQYVAFYEDDICLGGGIIEG